MFWLVDDADLNFKFLFFQVLKFRRQNDSQVQKDDGENQKSVDGFAHLVNDSLFLRKTIKLIK
jgi:hypothetical protein